MKEIILNVEGMVCEGCENRVINALKTIKEVEEVKADHKEGKVYITLNSEIQKDVLKEKIEDIGFEVKGN